MTQDSIAGLETPGMLDAGQKRAIARDNAAALFPRLAAG
jgi:hypothetical protein